MQPRLLHPSGKGVRPHGRPSERRLVRAERGAAPVLIELVPQSFHISEKSSRDRDEKDQIICSWSYEIPMLIGGTVPASREGLVARVSGCFECLHGCGGRDGNPSRRSGGGLDMPRTPSN